MLILKQFCLLFVLSCLLTSYTVAQNKIPAFERPADYKKSVFHVGLWVEDTEKMLDFLSVFMEYDILLRSERKAGGGKRLMLSDKHGQIIELLSDPKSVIAHSEFPLHPLGRIAGVAHIALHIEDAVRAKHQMEEKGYKILAQIPEDYSQGYVNDQGISYRILFVRGPSDISFELFEIHAEDR